MDLMSVFVTDQKLACFCVALEASKINVREFAYIIHIIITLLISRTAVRYCIIGRLKTRIYNERSATSACTSSSAVSVLGSV